MFNEAYFKISDEIVTWNYRYEIRKKQQEYLRKNNHLHNFGRDRVCLNCGIGLKEYKIQKGPEICKETGKKMEFIE